MIDEIQEYWPDAEGNTAMTTEEAPPPIGDPKSLLESLRNIQDLADHDELGLDAWRRLARLVIGRVFGFASVHFRDVGYVGAQCYPPYSPIETAWEPAKRSLSTLWRA